MNKNWKRKFYTIWTGQAISILSSAVLWLFADAAGIHTWFFISGLAILLLAAISSFFKHVRNTEQ